MLHSQDLSGARQELRQDRRWLRARNRLRDLRDRTALRRRRNRQHLCALYSVTCQALGAVCGEHSNRCGGRVNCGTCPTNQVCRDGQCCTPKTCAELGSTCGEVDNGCGGKVNCGTCQPNERCDTTGTANICVPCTPKTCAELGKQCGMTSNGCGGQVDCGPCQIGVCSEQQLLHPAALHQRMRSGRRRLRRPRAVSRLPDRAGMQRQPLLSAGHVRVTRARLRQRLEPMRRDAQLRHLPERPGMSEQRHVLRARAAAARRRAGRPSPTVAARSLTCPPCIPS